MEQIQHDTYLVPYFFDILFLWEEPDWIIQGGILCPRPGVADVEADIDQVYHQLNCSIVALFL